MSNYQTLEICRDGIAALKTSYRLHSDMDLCIPIHRKALERCAYEFGFLAVSSLISDLEREESWMLRSYASLLLGPLASDLMDGGLLDNITRQRAFAALDNVDANQYAGIQQRAIIGSMQYALVCLKHSGAMAWMQNIVLTQGETENSLKMSLLADTIYCLAM